MNIKIMKVDYSDPKQASEIIFLLNTYAQDPMDGSETLSQYIIENLVSELSKLPLKILRKNNNCSLTLILLSWGFKKPKYVVNINFAGTYA